MRLPKISASRWLCIGVALVCGLTLFLPAAFNPQSARAATVVVDDFSTSQADVEVYPDPDFSFPEDDSSSVSGAGILGGERDLRAQAIVEQLEPSNRGIFAGVANGRLEASSQTLPRGTITVQWDGADGDPVNLDATGLGGVDLTGGGTEDAFSLRVTQNYSDTPGLTITVYTDMDNFSSFDLGVGYAIPSTDYSVAFDEFTAAGGSGADFTDVGAITLSFSYHGAGGIGPYIDVFQTTQFDRLPPQTAVSLSGTAGANDWYTSTVQVTLNATDDFSGVADTFYSLDGGSFQTYSAPFFTISTDGQHTVEFYSTDLVSNTEATKTITVDIDQTAPSITGSALPGANANGWNNSDVTVSFTCTDTQGGSGVDTDSVTPPVPLNAEGANQSAGGDCSDLAGNSASTTVSNINIDKTAPVITVDTIQTADGQAFVPAPAVWTNQDVIVTFTCAEIGAVQSGIDEDSVPGVTLEADGANQTATSTGVCSDAAGNSATAANVSGINIDQTAPPAAAGGPYQVDEGGSISLDGSGSTDGLSGIASTAWALDGDSQFNDGDPASFSGLDGPAIITVTLQVTDAAGNVDTMDTTVTVNNLRPEILSVTNDGPPSAGSLVNITVDATDPAGLLDPLSYEFDCDNDLAYEVGPQPENSTACDIGVQEGGIAVNVRVTDGDGGETLGSTVISVPTEMCANRYTGTLRYSDSGCHGHETTVILTNEGSITVCVSNYTSVVRYLQRGSCAWSETRVTLPDDGPLAVCVSRYTQVMRAVDGIQQCQRWEESRIIGISPGSSSSDIGGRSR